MSKKSLNQNDVKKSIEEARALGKTDREIYDELSRIYFDKKSIAMSIKRTVTTERQIQYKIQHRILLSLIGISILLKILFVLGMSFSSQDPKLLLFVFFVPLVNVYFFYKIAKYDASSFLGCAIFGFIGLGQNFSKITNLTDMLVNLVVVGGIISLSFYLYSVLFPGFKNNMEKGKDGEYIA